MRYDLEKRTIGLNFTDDSKASFRLWSPPAGRAELIVNGEIMVLEKEDRGFWSLSTELIRPGDLYFVKTGNGPPLPDPASLSQPADVHGPSRATDIRSFQWQDTDWKGLDEEIILYELHTGTFTASGTFGGIADKIGYFRQLGINMIELMPVAQFPGRRNWGYDGVYPFAVQESYGGATGLQMLVNECHRNGIAVVLDVVYNHLGPEGNYLTELGPYFNNNYNTPWGRAINYDNEWSDGVRQFFTENMLMWFRDFHLDGLRLDAVHAIKDFSAKHFLRDLRETADELQQITGRRYLLIGEIDLNDNRYLNPPEKGGYRLDMQWCDEFHHALHALVTGERNGYYSDFGEMRQLTKAYNSGYVYDGVWSEHRKRTFGSSSQGFAGNRFIVFTQNHDQVGNRMRGDRIGNTISFEQLKLIAAAMFISPFIPLIFMGEEYGESNPFIYFTSHSDEELVEKVSKGRREEFPEFIDSEDFPEPQSEDTFKRSGLSFDISGRSQHIFGLYRELIRLKKDHPVLRDHDRSGINATEPIPGVLRLIRISGNHHITGFLNFNNEDIRFENHDHDPAKYKVLLNTSLKIWGGLDEKDFHSPDGTIVIRANSALVFSDII